jgi:hypothetical protein
MEGRPPTPHWPQRALGATSADGVELFNLAKVPITRYRCRGAQIPIPWILANPA